MVYLTVSLNKASCKNVNSSTIQTKNIQPVSKLTKTIKAQDKEAVTK